MTQQQHFDVAAYALGVLDPNDAARFEDHLIDCATCAMELESLLPVVDLLSDIDADSIVAVEQSRNDGMVLHQMIGEVSRERRRANSRRLYSLAAAVVVFAMLSIGALFAGGKWFTDGEPNGPGGVTAQNSTQLDPLPIGGVGGKDPVLVGERIAGSDPRTQVRLDAGLQKKDWGTQVSFLVGNIKGPLTCRLVAVRSNGGQEVLSTWTVGDKGWGTAAQPKPLMLQAATALQRNEIAHLLLQSIDSNGATAPLVRVP